MNVLGLYIFIHDQFNRNHLQNLERLTKNTMSLKGTVFETAFYGTQITTN